MALVVTERGGINNQAPKCVFHIRGVAGKRSSQIMFVVPGQYAQSIMPYLLSSSQDFPVYISHNLGKKTSVSIHNLIMVFL